MDQNRAQQARRGVRPRYEAPRCLIVMLFVITIAIILFWIFWFLPKLHQRLDERAEEIPVRRGGNGTSSDAGQILRHRRNPGRWYHRIFNHTGEVGLHGTDLVEGTVEETYADEYLRDRTEEEEDEESAEGYLNRKRRSFRSFRAKKGEIVVKVQQNEADILTVKWFQKPKSVEERSRTEVGSLSDLGAVISKSVDKQCEVFWDNDENGVPEHDAAIPRSDTQVDSVLKENVSSSGNDSDSKDLEACQQKLCVVLWDNDENGVPEHDAAVPRSDIQVDSVALKENVSSSGNDSESKDLEACQQKLCVVLWDNENRVPEHDAAVPRCDIQVDSVLKESVSSSGNDSDSKDLETCQQNCCVVQDDADKQSLSLCEAKAVPEEMTAAESGKESMRELLQEEM